MHERLSVSTIGFGPIPVVDLLEPLEACGITRVGVPIVQLETGNRAANLAALRSSGFDVTDVVEPTVFTLPDPSAHTGPVELELLGPRITAEGPAAAAKRAATVVSALL
jgi:hypothetical protein